MPCRPCLNSAYPFCRYHVLRHPSDRHHRNLPDSQGNIACIMIISHGYRGEILTKPLGIILRSRHRHSPVHYPDSSQALRCLPLSHEAMEDNQRGMLSLMGLPPPTDRTGPGPAGWCPASSRSPLPRPAVRRRGHWSRHRPRGCCSRAWCRGGSRMNRSRR